MDLHRRRLLAALEKRRGDKPYAHLAEDIGISQPMLWYLFRNNHPGIKTLAMLLHWDKDLEPLITDYLLELGKELRIAA